MARVQTPTAQGDDVIYEIINRIAEIEDVDPLELTPPLYEAIDPDALYQTLSARPTGGRMKGRVTFSYNGYEVTVGGDGSVSVED